MMVQGIYHKRIMIRQLKQLIITQDLIGISMVENKWRKKGEVGQMLDQDKQEVL